MNHRPFEDWLLNEQPLTNEQTRELQAHLRECSHCSALTEVNLALRSTRMATPSAGFSARFQQRLAAQRLRERRNRLIGAFVLMFSAVLVVGWFAAPFVIQLLVSPAAWITGWVGFFVSLIAMLQSISEIGSILLDVLPSFITPFGWLILVSSVSGFCLLWAVSIWRFTSFSQGVQR